jgi:hypothetical protein
MLQVTTTALNLDFDLTRQTIARVRVANNQLTEYDTEQETTITLGSKFIKALLDINKLRTTDNLDDGYQFDISINEINTFLDAGLLKTVRSDERTNEKFSLYAFSEDRKYRLILTKLGIEVASYLIPNAYQQTVKVYKTIPLSSNEPLIFTKFSTKVEVNNPAISLN